MDSASKWIHFNKRVTDIEIEKASRLETKNQAFFSANLMKFRSEIPLSDHYNAYLNLMTLRMILNSDAKDFRSYNELSVINPPKLDNSKPSIICTYHLGSYRAILGYLVQNSVDIALVVDDIVFETQYDYIHNLISEIKKHFNATGKFKLINAEHSDIAVTLISAIKNKLHIVAFIDGNTGPGGFFKNSSILRPVKFLNTEILVRKGIPYVSFLTKAKILPVISYFPKSKETKTVIEFLPSIDPSDNPSIHAYTDSAIAILWRHLEYKIRSYYDQWEGWFYIHKYINWGNSESQDDERETGTSEFIYDGYLRFNHVDFALFKFLDQYYILNKKSYRVSVVSEKVVTVIIHFNKTEVTSTKSLFEIFASYRSTINTLIKKKIIINCN